MVDNRIVQEVFKKDHNKKQREKHWKYNNKIRSLTINVKIN